MEVIMTQITLQVLPKNAMDHCLVNVEEKKLRYDVETKSYHDTYCRINHESMYRGHTLDYKNEDGSVKESIEFPDPVLAEFKWRMEQQVLPLLNRKGGTCEEFFQVKPHAELKSSLGISESASIYDVTIDVLGCPEHGTDTAHAHHGGEL